jgi:type IV fimbrial biogenesis protein FimT
MLSTRPSAGRPRRPGVQALGVSMIEMVVAMAIAAISIALVLPSVTGYFQNAKLRSTAQSFFTGAEMARTESIKRNGTGEFVLSAVGVTAANFGSVPPSITGQNWGVRVSPIPPSTDWAFVDARPVQEGNSTSVQVSSNVGLVGFNGLGQANAAMTIDFTNPNGGACAPAGPMRCLRLIVSTGGQVRLCDWQASNVSATDSRGC